MLQPKIPDAAAKTWLGQINEKKKKKNFFLNLLFTSHQVYVMLLQQPKLNKIGMEKNSVLDILNLT